MNRKKICYFIDKYVTRLYGSHHIQLWATKNQNRSIFDLIKMSDLVGGAIIKLAKIFVGLNDFFMRKWC
jgi:hypothetical protein